MTSDYPNLISLEFLIPHTHRHYSKQVWNSLYEKTIGVLYHLGVLGIKELIFLPFLSYHIYIKKRIDRIFLYIVEGEGKGSG